MNRARWLAAWLSVSLWRTSLIVTRTVFYIKGDTTEDTRAGKWKGWEEESLVVLNTGSSHSFAAAA